MVNASDSAKTRTMEETHLTDLEAVAAALTAAWNAGDGAAFARSFAPDADFVNIFAMHIVGREGIAKQHQFIFDGVYRGSRNLFTVKKSRPLGDGAILALIAAELQVPHGPMAGTIRTLATAVLEREAAGWLLVSFHNTLETTPPGPPPA